MEPEITSTTNPRVKHLRSLHRAKGRRAAQETLIEGPTSFASFLAAGHVPSSVVCLPDDTSTLTTCRGSGIPVTTVTPHVLVAASDAQHPKGPVAAVPIPPAAALRARHTVVLVGVSDPGNVGAIVRSAVAFGWDIAVDATSADPWSPKTIRSSAGAHAVAHLALLDDPVTETAQEDLRTFASVVSNGRPPAPADVPTALLIGSEAHGLPRDIVAACDETVTIPMVGETESLNASVAASILLYAMAR